MRKNPETTPSGTKPRRKPQLTEEAREGYLISLARNLVEERLLNGTASSQEVTQLLKLGADREKQKLELEILEKQKELIVAKTEALQSSKEIKELYIEAMDAMKKYSGHTDG